MPVNALLKNLTFATVSTHRLPRLHYPFGHLGGRRLGWLPKKPTPWKPDPPTPIPPPDPPDIDPGWGGVIPPGGIKPLPPGKKPKQIHPTRPSNREQLECWFMAVLACTDEAQQLLNDFQELLGLSDYIECVAECIAEWEAEGPAAVLACIVLECVIASEIEDQYFWDRLFEFLDDWIIVTNFPCYCAEFARCIFDGQDPYEDNAANNLYLCCLNSWDENFDNGQFDREGFINDLENDCF